MKRVILIGIGVVLMAGIVPVSAHENDPQRQERRQRKSDESQTASEYGPINDSHVPLHLLAPEYGIPYGELSVGQIKSDISRVIDYLEQATPAKVEDKITKAEITDFTQIDGNSQLVRGDFRLGSYEWGVVYTGMLRMASATSDARYADYVYSRLSFLARMAESFLQPLLDVGLIDPQMRQILEPQALDDAGSMCAAMIKAHREKPAGELMPMIDNYMNYLFYNEFRLSDRTFARNRPYKNTVWLDDMYMSLPAIAQMGALTGDTLYYNEAARQVKFFAEKMWVPENGLFRHGWVQSMKDHPSFYWGRANGWALLTLCEILDVLPDDHADRKYILDLLKKHIQSLSALQSGNGAWHQLLDRNDSFLETSCTAIFTYCIAHAINKGWIDGTVYGPVAHIGWQYISTQITPEGQVAGTCVGTGMAFDPAFYYHRPVNVYAAHGYGPVLLAAAEMIVLLDKLYPQMNDSAVQYYTSRPPHNAPGSIFSWEDAHRYYAPKAGTSRKGDNPVIFLIGDSTVKNGNGKGGSGNEWAWGSFFHEYVDTTRITVENHALGGRSSRTFITQGLWRAVLPGIRPGDYVLIQMGHNDGGELDTGRARASLKGIGEESKTVTLEATGAQETVYTYGHYLRRYIRQTKAQGAIPVVLSPTPTNRYTEGRVNRYDQTYAKWAREVAEQEGVYFIDLNEISALKIEAIGAETAKEMLYYDSVHNTREGAVMNAESVVEGIRELQNSNLKNFIK